MPYSTDLTMKQGQRGSNDFKEDDKSNKVEMTYFKNKKFILKSTRKVQKSFTRSEEGKPQWLSENNSRSIP